MGCTGGIAGHHAGLRVIQRHHGRQSLLAEVGICVYGHPGLIVISRLCLYQRNCKRQGGGGQSEQDCGQVSK